VFQSDAGLEFRSRTRGGLLVRVARHIPVFVWLSALAMFTIFFGSRLWDRHWSQEMTLEGLILGIVYALIFFAARRTLKMSDARPNGRRRLRSLSKHEKATEDIRGHYADLVRLDTHLDAMAKLIDGELFMRCYVVASRRNH